LKCYKNKNKNTANETSPKHHDTHILGVEQHKVMT